MVKPAWMFNAFTYLSAGLYMSKAINILPYIPQRAPFVMISELENCNEAGATTTFAVEAKNIFVEKGKLKEPALIENMAQTAAARIGYICKQEGKPVPVGFIGAVQHLKIMALPEVGDTLKTSVFIKNKIFNATIIEANICINEKKIAACEMKIFTQ